MKAQIEVSTLVNKPLEKVWKYFTEPKHIKNWYFATSEWHAPLVENDLKVSGKFKTRMEAVDGSEGFDFEGVYTKIEEFKLIEYVLDDGREVKVLFEDNPDAVLVRETFTPDKENSIELQKGGWQAILDNFKTYAEYI